MKYSYTPGARKTPAQILNLEKLLIMWELTPKDAVVTHLANWRYEGNHHPCGAVACLGGHAVASGFFPNMPTEKRFFGGDEDAPDSRVSAEWFGTSSLFWSRQHADGKGSDWAVAHRRIIRALNTEEQT
jgi:hypothetical protein